MNLKSHRKAAKILIAIAIAFAICHFPANLIATLRYCIILLNLPIPILQLLLSFMYYLVTQSIGRLIGSQNQLF